MIDTRIGQAPLAEFIDRRLLPAGTLGELSGDTYLAQADWFGSGLERRVAAAWRTPLSALTCGQARVLVGQRLGLQWLARPVAAFVRAYPQAECDLYEGDLTIASLCALDEFLTFAPDETVLMVHADFGWIERELTEDPDLRLAARALGALTAVRDSLGALETT
ncbi:MAG: hypothetical protein EON90_05350 [Brevundimonas sp.]|nr:MAG: hypothetical protein EON90_05350 [Brevundimonas sp.]